MLWHHHPGVVLTASNAFLDGLFGVDKAPAELFIIFQLIRQLIADCHFLVAKSGGLIRRIHGYF